MLGLEDGTVYSSGFIAMKFIFDARPHSSSLTDTSLALFEYMMIHRFGSLEGNVCSIKVGPGLDRHLSLLNDSLLPFDLPESDTFLLKSSPPLCLNGDPSNLGNIPSLILLPPLDL